MSLRLTSGVLHISKHELNLKPCLRGGMSFRWSIAQETSDLIEFIGVIREKIFKLTQHYARDVIEYTAYHHHNDENIHKQIELELKDYFRLDENLDELYAQWSSRDAKFKERISANREMLCGIRQLRLDPVENLFSFICSSNNNIKRITQMVNNMCVHFGKKIGRLDNATDYYSFPSVERLAQQDVEEKLRKLSFGYRAKFISQSAVYIQKNHSSSDWLYSLREKPYQQVVEELIKLPGIGKKVSDCICLMSLDKLEAVPVDTHVLSIARKTYDFMKSESCLSKGAPVAKSKSNTLSEKSYKAIGMLNLCTI